MRARVPGLPRWPSAVVGKRPVGADGVRGGEVTTDEGDADRLVRALVADHGRAVEALLASFEHDPVVRQDLWSEVFTTAYLRLDQLVGRSPDVVRKWLLRTARNLTANSARRAMTRRRLRDRMDREPAPQRPSAEDAYLGTGGWDLDPDHDEIRAAWAQLTDSQREVLALHAAGHDGPAVARALGISPAAARSRLMRARRAFLDVYELPGRSSDDA